MSDDIETETTHPRTGHPCRTPKDNVGPLPEDITIEIKRSRCFMEADIEGSCNKGTKGCFVDHVEDKDNWYAELSGIVEIGKGEGRFKVWAQLTHGNSVVSAAQAAAEVAKLCYEQCKEPGIPHCYCRDVTHSLPNDEDVTRAVQCCVCQTLMPTFAFVGEADPPVSPIAQAIIDSGEYKTLHLKDLPTEGVTLTEGDPDVCPCGERYDVPHHHDS